MKKALLFVNPALQRTHSRRRDLAEVLRIFRAAGVEVRRLETSETRDAGPQAARAAQEGYDTVIVCGGDGTIFDVIQGMGDSPVALGIIPFGTGNVLAQNLRIPERMAAAARWLLDANPMPVPLGRINLHDAQGREQSWLFAMAAGMGMHATLLQEARRGGKDVTGRGAYFAAGLRLLFHHPIRPFEAEITALDGTVTREQISEALAVRVAELNRWKPGGDLAFPFLRLATMPGASRTRLARAAWEAFFQSAGRRDLPEPQSAAANYRDVARIICRGNAVAIQADGEVLGTDYAEVEMANQSICFLAQEDRYCER